MQLSSTKGQESCTGIQPRFAWNDEGIDVGFACSHGTIIWVSMSVPEATQLVLELGAIVSDIAGVVSEDEEEPE